MSKSDKWQGVDLDATLAKYRGWQGHLHIGKPVLKMLARVKRWLREGKNVKIFSARVSGDDGRARKAIERWCEQYVGRKLPVTNVKDQNCARIWDDKATGVVKNEGKQVKHDFHEKHAGFMDGYLSKFADSADGPATGRPSHRSMKPGGMVDAKMRSALEEQQEIDQPLTFLGDEDEQQAREEVQGGVAEQSAPAVK